jgi:hypothetical protein
MQQQLWARDFQGLIHTCFDHCDGLCVEKTGKDKNVGGLEEEDEDGRMEEDKKRRESVLFFSRREIA